MNKRRVEQRLNVRLLWCSRVAARSPGAYLGVLFCDIDHFKDVNARADAAMYQAKQTGRNLVVRIGTTDNRHPGTGADRLHN